MIMTIWKKLYFWEKLTACTNLLSKSRNCLFHLLYHMRQKFLVIFVVVTLLLKQGTQIHYVSFCCVYLVANTPSLSLQKSNLRKVMAMKEHSSSRKKMDGRSSFDKASKWKPVHFCRPFISLPLYQNSYLATLSRMLQGISECEICQRTL